MTPADRYHYHGQEIKPGQPSVDAPSPPPDWHEGKAEFLHGEPISGVDASFIRQLRSVGQPEVGRKYPRVQLIGNYGLGCVDTQRLDYHDITPEQAGEHAWEAFGVCVHVIAYFDENDQLVASQ